MCLIQYEETNAFRKDLKKLLKKLKSLQEGLERVKSYAIELFHLQGLDNHTIFPICDFCTEEIQICKIKKFACKSLKGKGANSGIRVIYAYHVALKKVVFLEIYFKADQDNADYERLKKYHN